MKTASEIVGLRAIVLVDDPRQASGLVDGLSKRDISASVNTDPDEALGECRRNHPQLVIVAKGPRLNNRPPLPS